MLHYCKEEEQQMEHSKSSRIQRKLKCGGLVIFFSLCIPKDLEIQCMFVLFSHAHIHISFETDKVTPFSLCLQEHSASNI